jgi:hypothetical protein
MTNWTSINASQILPNALVSAVAAMSDALESLSVSFSLPSLPSLPSTPNTTATVVNAILNAIEDMVNGGQIHTLMIPIAKTYTDPVPPPLPPTLADLQSSLQITLGSDVTNAPDTYAKMVASTGGNAGFFNQFATSLTDPFDPNRPQYDNQTDAVVMAVLLVGSPDYASIVTAASVLHQLTAPKGGSDLTARTVPTPQNVTARVVGSSTARNIGVRLDWDRPTAVYTSPFFPRVATSVKRYAVIRSTDPSAPKARTVLDFFSTQTLTEGMTEGKTTVVTIGTGKNAAYLDTAAELDPKVPVYYCVAWETVVAEPKGQTTMPFDGISNVVKVMPVAPTAPQTGASPNWTATGAAVQAFPAISRASQVLIEEARVLLVPSGKSNTRLSGALDLAKAAAKRVSDRSTGLVNDVKRLAAALARPMPGLYITQMSSSTGGNAYLLAELSKRLGDMTDQSRPPYDNSEYVCGVCFVAGAPRLADLANVIAFFDALFGPAAAANPLLGLLASIDTAVAQAETVVFQPDMTPYPAGTDAASIDPATGKPLETTTVTIANDGTPVTTLSPDNPNAGDTNIVPTSELC